MELGREEAERRARETPSDPAVRIAYARHLHGIGHTQAAAYELGAAEQLGGFVPGVPEPDPILPLDPLFVAPSHIPDAFFPRPCGRPRLGEWRSRFAEALVREVRERRFLEDLAPYCELQPKSRGEYFDSREQTERIRGAWESGFAVHRNAILDAEIQAHLSQVEYHPGQLHFFVNSLIRRRAIPSCVFWRILRECSPMQASVVVRTRPSGAEVRIDESNDISPCTLKIAPERRRVRAELRRSDGVLLSTRGRITFLPGRAYALDLVLELPKPWHKTPPPGLELGNCPHCDQCGFVTYPGHRNCYDSGDHEYCFACGYSYTVPY